MARPTKSKDMKGKPLEAVEGGGAAGAAGGPGGGGSGGPSMVVLLAVALVVILGSAGASIASVFFVMPMVMQPMMDQVAAAAAKGGGGGHGSGHGEAGGGESAQVGPVVDLEEFTVNLNDPSGDRYLRADFSITVTTDDKAFGELSGEGLKKWEEEFHMEMAHYVPAIRDIVISALTQRTSEDLATEEGKEAVKKDIKAKVDKLLHGHHEVIRVNIENFIIQ